MKYIKTILLFIINHTSILWSDALYLRMIYFVKFGRRLNLINPILFTEKCQWLKLNKREAIYSVMADKVCAKDFVGQKIGYEHIIPTLAVYSSPESIDFDTLPNQFVIKCNHNSGYGMVICKDKSRLNVRKVKKKLWKGIKQNYYLNWREWPYKNIPRRILVEKYMDPEDGNDVLLDYKFFCFNGVPKIVYISNDGANHSTTDFFDMEFNHLNLRMKDPNSIVSPKKPEHFEEMKSYAEVLSKGTVFLRVDFYLISHVVYFGELTFFHNAGFSPINPPTWDKIMGDWMDINA